MTLKELSNIILENNTDDPIIEHNYSKDKNKKVEFYTSDTNQSLSLLSIYRHKGKIIIDIG